MPDRSDADSPEAKGLTRRELLRKLGKAAYVAPTLTVLTLTPIRAAANSHDLPPPVPDQGPPGPPGPG